MIVEAMKLAGVENFPMESRPPNLGRQTYRDTRQTRQSLIRRLTPNNRFPSKNGQVRKTSKSPRKQRFFGGLLSSMYLCNEFDTPFTFVGK